MCELFGVSAAVPIPVNGLLKEFFSHSTEHPNGWGIATFHGNAASLEKEPVPAFRSSYLKARLSHPLETDGMIAHIRLATVGSMDYENCHPFVQRDCFHRCWTLAHNGTMFHCPALAPYQYVQEGRTDSERILCCLIDRMNRAAAEAGRELTAEERFRFLDRFVCEMTPGNKMNFLLYDGSFCTFIPTTQTPSMWLSCPTGYCSPPLRWAITVGRLRHSLRSAPTKRGSWSTPARTTATSILTMRRIRTSCFWILQPCEQISKGATEPEA